MLTEFHVTSRENANSEKFVLVFLSILTQTFVKSNFQSHVMQILCNIRGFKKVRKKSTNSDFSEKRRSKNHGARIDFSAGCSSMFTKILANEIVGSFQFFV